MKNDELHIITSILAGNTERFSYFLDTYGQQIFTLIVRMVGSPEDAEELTQDTFMRHSATCRTSTAKVRFLPGSTGLPTTQPCLHYGNSRTKSCPLTTGYGTT